MLKRSGLRAALAQRGTPPLEVVIVDDASDSPCPGLDGDAHSSVRIVRHSKRQGDAAARNTGIAHVRAPWIAFLDDDDLWAPERLVRMLSVLKRDGADFAYSGAILVDSSLRPLWRVEAPAPSDLGDLLRHTNALPAGASNVVARTSLMRSIGGFDESFTALSDWDCWLRLVKTARGVAIDETLVAYRESSRVAREETVHRSDLQRLAAKHPDIVPDPVSWEGWIAKALLARGERREAAGRYLRAGLRNRDMKSVAQAAAVAVPPHLRARIRRGPPVLAPGWLSVFE